MNTISNNESTSKEATNQEDGSNLGRTRKRTRTAMASSTTAGGAASEEGSNLDHTQTRARTAMTSSAATGGATSGNLVQMTPPAVMATGRTWTGTKTALTSPTTTTTTTAGGTTNVNPTVTMAMINSLIRNNVTILTAQHYKKYNAVPEMKDFDLLAARMLQTHSWFKDRKVLRKLGNNPLQTLKRKMKKRFHNAKTNLIESSETAEIIDHSMLFQHPCCACMSSECSSPL